MKNEFVVNWHITEACNYRCHFCFSHWQNKEARDLVKNLTASFALIDHLQLAFEKFLSKEWGFDSLRINFAGGEPLLYCDQLLAIAQYCQSKGIRTSLISNATYLLEKQVSLHDFNMIGISIDSTHAATNLVVGRHDRKDQTLDIDALKRYVKNLKAQSLVLDLKINTVVNAANWQEDMSEFIADIAPNKWKIFKMLPVITDQLSVTDLQFQAFLDRHEMHDKLIVSENNEEMTESYLMIDPNGRFYSNANTIESGKYRYSSVINQVGVMDAIAEIDFDLHKFKARY